MSYKLKEVTKGSVFKSKDMGCPIPPPAPRTATFRSARAEEENARRARVRAAVDRANIFGLCGCVGDVRRGDKDGMG